MRWGELERFEDSFLAAPAARHVGAVDSEATVRLIGVLKSAKAVERFLGFVAAFGFAASPLDADGTRFVLIGTYGGVEHAFRPEGLGLYEEMTAWGARQFVARSGYISLPAHCLPDVIAVMGIDQRHCGRPSTSDAVPNANRLYHPREIAARYDFPMSWDGTGQTVGIIALGGGYLEAELRDYMEAEHVKWTGKIFQLSADGTVSEPKLDSMNLDHNTNVFEVQMDISVVAAVAPGAQIIVYFGEAHSQKGLYAALNKAIYDDLHKPSVISVSWQFPRRSIPPSCLNAFEELLLEAQKRRITVCVASGDFGALASGGNARPDVAFPACLRYVLACGGTALDANDVESAWGRNTNFGSEGVGSGGGYGDLPMPGYQQGAVTPGIGRGVPDVAAMAMPGYDSVHKRWRGRPFSGTSAATPLWAALIALINQGRQHQTGTPVGFINETLYQHQDTAFVDIQRGSNTAFQAERGWDELTGLGTPRGSEILRLF